MESINSLPLLVIVAFFIIVLVKMSDYSNGESEVTENHELCRQKLNEVIERSGDPAKEQINGALKGCNFGAPLG